MSVLIKGMKMPEDGNWKTIRIYPDGTCARPDAYGDCHVYKDVIAIEVPTPHGGLIDADVLKQKKKHSNEFAENVVSVAEIDWMPAIIEAEGKDINVTTKEDG